MAMLRLWAPRPCAPSRCSVSDTVPMRRTTTGSLLRALQLFENCMLDYSLRACVYNNSLNNAMPVRKEASLAERATL